MKKTNYKIKIKSTVDFFLEYSIYSISNEQNNDIPFFLYLHGLPGAPFHELSYTPYFLGKLGFNTIVFNYPGMWSKNGFFSATDVLNGVIGILQIVSNTLNLVSINFFGESFGGAVALNILGKDISPIPIHKIVLRSPLLNLKPFMVFLPNTLQYLKQAKIINIHSIQSTLQDLKILDPTQYYQKISNINNVKIWGVIGKNDDVFPSDKMLEAITKYPSIHVELWDDFPHNDIDDYLYEKFGQKLKDFMKS